MGAQGAWQGARASDLPRVTPVRGWHSGLGSCPQGRALVPVEQKARVTMKPDEGYAVGSRLKAWRRG